MSLPEEAIARLQAIEGLVFLPHQPLAPYTRFGIGGPASAFCETPSIAAFTAALEVSTQQSLRTIVIGGGSNLVVADAGFDGVVLRFIGSAITTEGTMIHAEAGAVLQDVVDKSNALGLRGLETMTGIPGYLGGAVYGNAGAYGHSIQELVTDVAFVNGTQLRAFSNAECQFRYRDSIFKLHKEWIIVSASLRMSEADPQALITASSEIRAVRDAKYPPTMKCAGSIFKNVFLADLPAQVQAEVPLKLVRDGKIPSAWFLEQAGVKGLRRGDIQVAAYHANLIYNDGHGTAADLIAVIEEVKQRVRDRFGFDLAEEVQYVGFDARL